MQGIEHNTPFVSRAQFSQWEVKYSAFFLKFFGFLRELEISRVASGNMIKMQVKNDAYRALLNGNLHISLHQWQGTHFDGSKWKIHFGE